MLEPSFRQVLQCIKEVEHLRYIIAMIVWFQCWRQDQGWWPLLPTCNFQVGALATADIETRVMSILSQIDMSLGERQVLQVLTTLQYLAEIGLKSPPPRHVEHSVQSIMRPLEQRFISCLMLCWGTAPPFDKVLQSKQMHHVWMYCHYPQVYAPQGTCLNLTIDIEIMSQPLEA